MNLSKLVNCVGLYTAKSVKIGITVYSVKILITAITFKTDKTVLTGV